MSALLPFGAYRAKVLGCWLGKAVGGTLGGPVEGHDGPLALTYYDPVPDRMLPNDDLDLQVVWLETIRRRGLPIERRSLAEAWLEHVRLWPDEYGVACRNLTRGLYPPVSGSYDNGFTAGMGAAIRTEIWACLAPGDPALAAALASEDACVDHAGEGLHAARYLAALESAAFLESDHETLLDSAARLIPTDCRVARAIADTRRWWAQSHDWLQVRERILAVHGRQNFTDVAQNLAFIVLGWLAGEGSFDRAICTAVNCGQDADCTGATLGALLGILDPDAIGEAWLRPIGRNVVLSPGMVGMHPPATLDELTDQVVDLAAEVLAYYGSDVRLGGSPVRCGSRSTPRFLCGALVALDEGAGSAQSLVATDPVVVTVSYPAQVALLPGRPSELCVDVHNPTDHALDLRVRAHAPDGWIVWGGDAALTLAPRQAAGFALTVQPPPADAVRVYRNPLDLQFESGGLRWVVSAGLVTTLPWLRWPLEALPAREPQPPDDAEAVEAAGQVQPLAQGGWAYMTEFKMPYSATVRCVVQAPREVMVWVDGEEVNHHDGSWRVPAFHRARETAADVELERGWHRLTVALGAGRDGELFVGLGSGDTWDWLRDVEWRQPTALGRGG